jgi:essential nuclear protein 1
MKICQMSYSGTNSVFIRILLNKKYALPYKVVDAVVEHFVGFTADKRQMPVVWHHALLVFAQRYRNVLTRQQKEQMRGLLKKQHHHIMTDQIRRELFAGRVRGEKQKPASGMDLS